MINFEIPYWTWIQIKCPSCGYEWLPNSKKKWMILYEILFYICWIFPGIVYSIRRNSSRICRCPRCWEVNVKEINWDDQLVNNLVKINKIQNYAFVAAILIFVLLIFWTRDYKLLNQNQQITIKNVNYQQPSNNTNSYNVNHVVKNVQETKKEKEETEEVIVQQKVEEVILQPKVEEVKDPNDEVREKMQDILKQIDQQYSNEQSYIWSSCSWDCINWIVNIKFAKNIWWRDFTVKAHAADWSNKIIRAIPGYFEKIQINFICHDQTITSCTFTEYQANSFASKWCEYYWYKDTADEAREKMQDILKQIDYKYGEDIRLKQDSYIWASCSWDCIDWIVNINFSENIGRYDFTVKAHAADWSNAIIKAIPGFFDKLQINFICKWQTICSCTFTEYQTNSFAPKWCTYYWFKE